MRLALLFSGQGQQTAAHLHQLRALATPPLRDALAEALGELWDEADTENAATGDLDIYANRIAQPLIFGLQMAYWQALQSSLPPPVCVAGYSLGEMAACAMAGLFDAAAGVALCHERAKLMDGAAVGDFAMLAVLGLPEAALRGVIAPQGWAVAIRNSPTHWVITGPAIAQSTITAALTVTGANRLTPLAVQTPSHTPWLAAAAAQFADHLKPYNDGPALACPVVSAVDGSLSYSRSAATAALARQLSTTLHWETALASVREMQPDAVLEIGLGNALAKLWTEAVPDVPVRSVGDFKTLVGVSEWLGRMI